MSNASVTIKMCYVYNQWYDISCATLYNVFIVISTNLFETILVLRKIQRDITNVHRSSCKAQIIFVRF